MHTCVCVFWWLNSLYQQSTVSEVLTALSSARSSSLTQRIKYLSFCLKLMSSKRSNAWWDLCSRQVETNSRLAHEGNTFGLNTIRLRIVCTASTSPQGHPIQTITLFSPFGVFSLCSLDGEQQTPSCGNSNLFIFLTLGVDTRFFQRSYIAPSFAFSLRREALNAVLCLHFVWENLYEAFELRFLCLMAV